MNSANWEKVLVLQTSFLGDTVLTLPLLAEIKLRFPSTNLAVLCSPLGKELLQDYPGVDEIIVDDKKGADKGLQGLWRKAKALREKAFTMALTPHKSLRSALLLYLARIPYRVGFRQSRGAVLFNRRVHRDAERHDVERNLSILEAFGIKSEECQRILHLPVNPAQQDSVNRLLLSLGVDLEKLILGVNPGSVWPTKRWTAEGFARLIELFKQHYDCEVLLFGGPQDAAIVSRICGLSGGSAANLVGRIGLRELPAALGLCRVLVTNDSGPMHIDRCDFLCHNTRAWILSLLGQFHRIGKGASLSALRLPWRKALSLGNRRLYTSNQTGKCIPSGKAVDRSGLKNTICRFKPIQARVCLPLTF